VIKEENSVTNGLFIGPPRDPHWRLAVTNDSVAFRKRASAANYILARTFSARATYLILEPMPLDTVPALLNDNPQLSQSEQTSIFMTPTISLRDGHSWTGSYAARGMNVPNFLA
jgi:hypothetical protein